MKDMLRHKGFSGSIETSLEDNCLHGTILFIDDLVTYEAKTLADLKTEFESAVEDYISTCEEIGRQPMKPCSGTFNIRIGPELHQKTAQHAAEAGSSINDVIKKALIAYIDKPKHLSYDNQIDIRLSKKLIAALTDEAASQGVSISTYINGLLAERNAYKRVEESMQKLSSRITGLLMAGAQ